MLTIDQLYNYWAKYQHTTFITLNNENRPYKVSSNPLRAPWKFKLKGHCIYIEERCFVFNKIRHNMIGNALIILDHKTETDSIETVVIKLPRFYNQDALITDPRIKKIHLI
jgi:hypothetical protein